MNGQTRATDESRRLLDAWRDSERFQAMTVPQPKRKAEDRARETFGQFDDMVREWPPVPRTGQKSRAAHTLVTRVFVGCVPQREIDERLHMLFTAESRFKQTRVAPGSVWTPIAYFDVDEQGMPIDESLAICALPEFTFNLWQLTGGAAADDKSLQAALDYVDVRAEQLTETFTELTSGDGEPLESLALTRKLVAAVTLSARHLLVWNNQSGRQSARTIFNGVWVRSGQEREPDLLSSFFIPDLEKARSLAEYPPALAAYMSAVGALSGQRPHEEDEGEPGGRHSRQAQAPGGEQHAAAAAAAVPGRVDMSLRRNREPLVDLQRLPRAAWPSGHPLRLSQQLAVTAVLEHAGTMDRSDGGLALLSVNGPPGTGKTTLLRDLYANLVVRRARVLAAFDDPQEAVSDPMTTYTRTDEREIPLRISALDPRLAGFEMVVTSSNNAAVENVSGALPAVGALAEQWRVEARYFRGPAQMVARKWAEHPDPQGRPRRRVEPWGLAAAILGRRSYVGIFAEGLGLFEGRAATGSGSMRETLAAGATPAEWAGARTAFERASAAVEAALQERQSAVSRLRGLDQLRAEQQQSQSTLAGLREQRPAAAESVQQAVQAAEAAAAASASADAAMRRPAADQPGWWARMRRTEAAAQWAETHAAARRTAASSAATYAKAQAQADTAREALQTSTGLIDEQSRRLDELHTRLAAAEQAVAADAGQFSALVTEAWWHRPQDETELGSAWVDAEVQQLRETLFLTAMTLHETFARVVGEQTLQALRVWKALVLHELRPEDRHKVAVRAWQWLFMVVPLVSTTFASLGRMLGDVDGPQLGWVIVDEAGQATPQSAVGAMMRFQHAVVVGDPDQLEPVVTLPDELLDRVASHRGAPAQASSSRCSVQLLADAANPFGTLRNGRWVGLPLLVHNRCVDTMYTLANTIAYQAGMVLGRLTDPDTVPAPSGPSRWIDVPLVGGTHWSDKSAVAVRGLLEELRPVASDPKQFVSVALLSPFRAVVAELRALREEFLQSLGLDPDGAGEDAQAAAVTALGPLWEGLDESPVDRLTAGTVHTFQGREKDAVVFVLGGASDGARRWVAGTPNLINVALTRARDRVYVVGDWDAWAVGHAGEMRNPALLLPP